MNYKLCLQSQHAEEQQSQQNDSQPAGASPMQESAPGTDDQMQTENESEPENGIQLNGAASNKIESNGQSNADQVEPMKNDQPNSNISAVVAAAAVAAPAPVSSVAATAAASITTTQPPPQQNPPIQPLMNMPIQPQGPPAQMQSQFNTPPPFAGFGMPPPNYMYAPPWQMPWQQPMPQQQIANDKSRIIDPQVK